MKTLVVLSGGLDSTTALVLSVDREGKEDVLAISFNYGQRHVSEIEAAIDIAIYYNIPHRIQDVELGKGGVLLKDEEMPHMTYQEIQEAEGPSPTYVPYRNGTFLSLAASYALEVGCEQIVAGMHAEDAHNWAYPDCTPEFLGAMQAAIYIGSYHQVRLSAPFTYLTKAEIILLGEVLKAPYELTMSCYEGTRPACGRCPTCVARREAFRQAGVEDPLEYATEVVNG